MGFSKCVLLLFAISASTTNTIVTGFVPTTSTSQGPNARQFGIVASSYPTRFHALSVALASVDDLIASSGADANTPSPEDFIVNAGELDNEPVDQALDTGSSIAYNFQARIQEIRTKYRRSETDSGSAEFQIAGMTERINYLTEHMRLHPKDFSTRRGLVALVNKRRRLLNYLFLEDVNRYSELVNGLGIRHKAPSRVLSREDQYGRFNGPKDPFKYQNKTPKNK